MDKTRVLWLTLGFALALAAAGPARAQISSSGDIATNSLNFGALAILTVGNSSGGASFGISNGAVLAGLPGSFRVVVGNGTMNNNLSIAGAGSVGYPDRKSRRLNSRH